MLLGNLDSTKREVTIVGAGIAGMLAAYQLDKQGYIVTLLESSPRAGGLIQTRQAQHGIAETAAHSLLASPAVKELCDELGVELREVRKDSRAKFIVRDGRLRRFPLNLKEVGGILKRMAFARSPNDEKGMTLEAWARRHLGESALQYLLTPLVRGIYGVQPRELGVAAAFPGLLVEPGSTLFGKIARKAFSRSPKKISGGKKGSGPMVAPLNSMSDLVERLEQRLEQRLGERFRKGVTVDSVPDAPNVIIATPTNAAAILIEPESPELSRMLREVHYTPLVSVTAFVDRAACPSIVKGVGALVPESENRHCLGILFTSSSFEGRVSDDNRFASYTVLLGGTSNPQLVNATDDEIKWEIRHELAGLLGLEGEPIEVVITRWPRAIPQYSTELPRLWETAKATWCSRPGRLLFGNYTGQVSLRGMIESVASM